MSDVDAVLIVFVAGVTIVCGFVVLFGLCVGAALAVRAVMESWWDA